jgi:NDP-sugar pyrophosphorylase family protein
MQAVVLAGGKRASRLRPLTDTVPEPFLLVEREPAFDLLIRRLETGGINEIIVIGGGHADAISASVLNRGYRAWIQVLPEPRLLGDAGALKRIARLIHGTFLVAHANAVIEFDLRRMVAAHFRSAALVTIASLRPGEEPSCLSKEVDETDRTRRLEDPATAARLAGVGPYLMEPEALELIPKRQAYSIATDLLPRLITEGAPIFAVELSGRRFALDCLESYLECQRWCLRSTHGGGFIHPSACVAADAQLRPPFFIGPGSRVEHGAVVGPDVVLTRQVELGPRSRISDSIVYPRVRIGARCLIQCSVIAPDVRLFDDVRLVSHVIIGAGAWIDSHRVLRAGSRVPSAPSAADSLRALAGG